MKIETKFNVGDEVWALNDTKLEQRTVNSIKIEATQKGIEIQYFFKIEEKYEIKNENFVFNSREEFVNQISTK